jgi:hypothetical protein
MRFRRYFEGNVRHTWLRLLYTVCPNKSGVLSVLNRFLGSHCSLEAYSLQQRAALAIFAAPPPLTAASSS